MPDFDCDILHEAGDWPPTPFIEEAIAAALKTLGHNQPCEISIVLSDDAHIRTLNRDYRGKDKATNVLSFPQDDPFLLGDIILAIETITREAEEQNKSFNAHLTHMLVHGCLHLLGHDHEDDDEAQIMEDLEVRILKQLKIKNPYDS